MALIADGGIEQKPRRLDRIARDHRIVGALKTSALPYIAYYHIIMYAGEAWSRSGSWPRFIHQETRGILPLECKSMARPAEIGRDVSSMRGRRAAEQHLNGSPGLKFPALENGLRASATNSPPGRRRPIPRRGLEC